MTEHLTKQTFLEKVFDYEHKQEWEYQGDKPAIIDFWAEWCQPCKMVAPVLEELDKEYGGKLQVYKINTEEEQELAAAFGIRSIPSLLFIPLNDKPQMAVGAYPKETLKEIVEKVLFAEKVAE
jgi:thioredoxin 1